MSLFLLIREADYRKLITCIKEQYDLIIDQIRTFSHVLYKVCQPQPMSHCLPSLTSFSSRKTIISASSLNMLQVLQYWMFCQPVQMLLKKNPKPNHQQSTCRILQGTALVRQTQQCNSRR